jgi:hypothetical protein
VSLESVGAGPVTIVSARIDAPGQGFAIGAFTTPFEMAPGTTLSIPVCYSPSIDGASDRATLLLQTTDTARSEIAIPLSGSTMLGLGTQSALSFGIVADGIARDTVITITNPSARPLAITGARVGGPFTVTSALPVVVPAGGSGELALRVANVPAYARETLVLETSHPCGDSLVVLLDALSDDRFTVLARADTALARWGERVSIPIAYEDVNGARLSSFVLRVNAAPTLLDVRSVDPAAGVTVGDVTIDPVTGDVEMVIESANGEPIASNAALVAITYDVLRGDRIATPIVPVVLGARPGVTSESQPGAFLLADYCDAHARLLTTSGSIALEQNAPNPTSGVTTIELETAFDGPVLLALFDARGDEVARILDEWMPAGRRRIEVSTRDLPSGTYTYRMVTGMQTLTRRMVVTP